MFPPLMLMKTTGRQTLSDLACLFLKLGSIAFGGPAAHISMMEEEIVRRRKWLSSEEFLDLLGATHLIPGPNSTELAIHIGLRRGGWLGLLIAGICFILPAAIIVTAIAWIYVRFGHLPKAIGILYGIKPVIIAIIIQALWNLGHSAIKNRLLAMVGLVAVGCLFCGMNELVVLFGAGMFMVTIQSLRNSHYLRLNTWFSGIALPLPLLGAVSIVSTTIVPLSQSSLFLFFLKVGSVLFGSGYVLLAFLRADLVDRWHWLTESQLMDAIAVGQFTPGPLLTTATFIGYILSGIPGAVLATIGIFLPAFFFVAISGPLVPQLRKSPAAATFLDGVNVASLAMMATVTWQLGSATFINWTSVSITLISSLCLFVLRINSSWLVLIGAIFGLLVS